MRRALVIVLIDLLVTQATQIRRLELLTSGPPSELAKELTFDEAEKLGQSYWLFEVREIEDLADLVKFYHRGDSVWLGHGYSLSLGWFNLSTNKSNNYLNSKFGPDFKKPHCPRCCLIFRAQKNNIQRKFTPILELADCRLKFKGAWAILRSRKSSIKEALDKLREEFNNYRNGVGEIVTLDSI